MFVEMFQCEDKKMNNVETLFDAIIPEKITECKFQEMTFTKEMLELYFLIDGKTPLADIGEQMRIDVIELATYLEKMTQAGLVRVNKSIPIR